MGKFNIIKISIIVALIFFFINSLYIIGKKCSDIVYNLKPETIIVFDTVYVGTIELNGICFEITGNKEIEDLRCNK
jgi:hypothetical protein